MTDLRITSFRANRAYVLDKMRGGVLTVQLPDGDRHTYQLFVTKPTWRVYSKGLLVEEGSLPL